MLKRFSVYIFNKLFHRNLYDEPFEAFFLIVKKYLVDNDQNGKILDAACGFHNRYISKLLSNNYLNVEKLIGLDIDETVNQKNNIHNKIIIQDLHSPIKLDNIQGIISLYTWEHLHSPNVVLKNFNNILNDNGVVIIIASQRYYYISILERIMPAYLKNLIWKLLAGQDKMPYPAYFNLCAETALGLAAEEYGYKLEEYISMEPAPTWYVKIFPIFLVMCFWMFLMNKFTIFKNIRGTFIAVLIKKDLSIDSSST